MKNKVCQTLCGPMLGYHRNIILLLFLVTLPDATVGTIPRTKTDLHRSRTHNEQTLMRSCGIMLGHIPFYNAEAVSNVLASVFCHVHCDQIQLG
jgi:hypothetical protein